MERRVVFKFGSGILTCQDRVELDTDQLDQLVGAMAKLRLAGWQCVLVSSGAVAAGMPCFGFSERPTDVTILQACAAIGQTRLMQAYESRFRSFDLHVGQLLLTHGDLRGPNRSQNVRNTIEQLLAFQNTIPVINENDSVAVDELRYGDNDLLSADVSVLIEAKQLVLLTTVDGLFPPNSDQIVTEVTDMSDVFTFATSEKGSTSVGGMASKLRAVERATQAGIETYIANGRRPDQLGQLIQGQGHGTRFIPQLA